MPRFGDAERHIARLLHSGCTFVLGSDCYTIVESGKPTCRNGEPKTDIYVAAESDRGELIEIKLVTKKTMQTSLKIKHLPKGLKLFSV